MSKLLKFLLAASLALCLIFFIMYEALGNVHDDTPIPVRYPDSGLSDNLFVSQNSQYVPNETLPVQYSFQDVPYIIDLKEGDTADVGTGHIVYGNDNVCFYISQIGDTKSPHEAVLEQYPQVVYINYSQSDSYAQTVKEDHGYLNGLEATYFVDHLLISTGSTQSARSAYVLGYCIDLGEEHAYNVIVSIATTLEGTDAFETCKELLDTLVYTLRYDAKLDKQQTQAREQAEKEEQRATEQAAREKEQQIKQQEQDSANALRQQREAAEAARKESLLDQKQLPVMVTRDFTNLTILVTWTKDNKDAELSFRSKDDVIHIVPTTSLSKQAIIDVGACREGEYILNITHYSACGDVSMKLIENN